MIAFTLFPIFLFGTLFYRYIFKLPEQLPPLECNYMNIVVNDKIHFHLVYDCNSHRPDRTREFLKTLAEIASKDGMMSFDLYSMGGGKDMFICSKLDYENESLKQNIIEDILADERFNFHSIEKDYGSQEEMLNDLMTIAEEEEECCDDKVDSPEKEDKEDNECSNEVASPEEDTDFVNIEDDDKKNI